MMDESKVDEILTGALSTVPDGKQAYDVLWWEEDGCQRTVVVRWKNQKQREYVLKKNEDGHWTNAVKLPNGIDAGKAIYLGSVYRHG